MILKQHISPIIFEKGNTKFEFLPTGDVLQVLNKEVMINQFVGNLLDGSINNIYMRIYKGETIKSVPLLGHLSKSQFQYSENKAIWEGEVDAITYRVVFTLQEEEIWFWQVEVSGHGETIDFVYGQDISLANKGGTLANELYMSQYIDHKVLENETGYVISSRQNQDQNGAFPYVQQGAIDTKIVAFSTDGMQFFGKDYKITHVPAVLKGDLPSVNYQFEMAYIGLQTEKIVLNKQHQATFYGVFKETYNKAIETIEFKPCVEKAYGALINSESQDTQCPEQIIIKDMFGKPFVSDAFTKEELATYFQERKIEEYDDEKLMAFFMPGHKHVVLQEKEVKLERPHGHIMTSGVSSKHISDGLITSTSYMMGIFNAQVTVGNTSLHKFLSTPRGLLNNFKTEGQRIYVKVANQYQILTMPAAYELGMNYSKWYYKIEDDILTVVAYAAANDADLVLEVNSEKGRNYEFIITNQVVMGEHEFLQEANLEVEEDCIKIYPDKNYFATKVYPNLHYVMRTVGAKSKVGQDEIFYNDGKVRNGALITLTLEATNHFQIVMEGHLKERDIVRNKIYTLTEEIKKFDALYEDLTCGFKLTLPKTKNKDLDKINEIFWWYTHNAMTHYAVPHGLEQPGGAAWGTRDVCQGPIEYFLMTQHYDLVREIIEEIFSHQFMEVGEWPQWFMFDNHNMQQDDCHGDVVFWPLKVLGDYITATGDASILEAKLHYRHFETGKVTALKETILEHVKRAVETIKARYVYDTALISYAGGDWDDTLQPANAALKEKMVSAWTVALAYQTLNQLSEVVGKKDAIYSLELGGMVKDIKAAFGKYLIKDNVIAGFAYCKDPDTIEYMLHPEDQKTGIQYRLLPMTRSIISELVGKEQAEKNVSLIKENLMCPDGVRLMNNPAKYKGGVSEIFKRAEQASNVGREIGLNYVHAHIRFIEAMAKLGNAQDAWKALMTINPINIKEEVKNAMIRQSNVYFSSSDAMFNDRYSFQENFDKVRSGEVGVKAGWRLYSSGPGIYLNQLVSNVLGLRFTEDKIIIDPVISKDLDGLNFNYQYASKPINFIYTIENSGKVVNKVCVNGMEVCFGKHHNAYREGGIEIDKNVVEKHLKDNNTIEIYMN